MEINWKERWDKRYLEDAYAYGTEPNEWIKEQLPSWSPGKVLCAAEGQGRNAIFTAGLGWDTYAFDLSESGVQRAKELAQGKGVSLEFKCADVREVSYPDSFFDALILVFAHFPAQFRLMAHQRLLRFLKPGAIILFEAFEKRQIDYQKKYPSGGPSEPAMLYDEEEVRREFPDCEFKILSSQEVLLNEGPYHQGPGYTVRFLAIKK